MNMQKFWHWGVLVAVIFAVIYVYNAGTLSGVPVVGRYLAK